MILSKVVGPIGQPIIARTFSIGARAFPRIRIAMRKSLVQQRCYAQPTSKPSRAESALLRMSQEAGKASKDGKLPEKMLIYHAGTGRTTFLALFKVTALIVGAFFVGIVTPTYIRSDKPMGDTAQVIIFGILPPIFAGIITSPFVTHIHVHLPTQARISRTHLEKFVSGGLSPSTNLSITTMTGIGKPRITNIQAGDLIPAHRRFGIVNYIRREGEDLQKERQWRKWYMFRPVTNLYIQPGRPGEARKVRYQKPKADKVEWWIWESLHDKIASRAATTSNST